MDGWYQGTGRAPQVAPAPPSRVPGSQEGDDFHLFAYEFPVAYQNFMDTQGLSSVGFAE